MEGGVYVLWKASRHFSSKIMNQVYRLCSSLYLCVVLGEGRPPFMLAKEMTQGQNKLCSQLERVNVEFKL